MKVSKLLLVLLFLVFIMGCSSYSASYSFSGSYKNNGMPKSNYYSRYNATHSVTESTNSNKVGKSQARCVFGLVSMGDASIASAMQEGKVRKIHHVDSSIYSVSFMFFFLNGFPIYQEHTTLVYGVE